MTLPNLSAMGIITWSRRTWYRDDSCTGENEFSRSRSHDDHKVKREFALKFPDGGTSRLSSPTSIHLPFLGPAQYFLSLLNLQLRQSQMPPRYAPPDSQAFRDPPLPHPAEDLSADDDLLSWVLVDQLGAMPNTKLGVHPQQVKFVGPAFKPDEVLAIVKEVRFPHWAKC